MLLDGKVVVVIGGTSGIGLATAEQALGAGARVVIASRSAEKLKRASERLGGRIEARELDVTRESDVRAFFEGLGSLDHLVTSVGGGAMGRFVDLDPATARGAFDGKFWGQYHAARAAAPRIRAGGSITLFSGIASRKAMPGMAAIAAINGAIEALCRTLAIELAPVRVNVVSPGLVATPAYDRMPAAQRQGMFDAVAAGLPVKRVGAAEDVAQTVRYLLANGYTTGTVVDVDGGHRLI
jgi:NAD(P)-dependent dehydrogenase (short-subunit alcohol dehydrogenase family)